MSAYVCLVYHCGAGVLRLCWPLRAGFGFCMFDYVLCCITQMTVRTTTSRPRISMQSKRADKGGVARYLASWRTAMACLRQEGRAAQRCIFQARRKRGTPRIRITQVDMPHRICLLILPLCHDAPMGAQPSMRSYQPPLGSISYAPAHPPCEPPLAKCPRTTRRPARRTGPAKVRLGATCSGATARGCRTEHSTGRCSGGSLCPDQKRR